MESWLAKSWLFEIVDIKSKKIEQSFTLVLPPNQYTIKEKHRVSITKTFGNAFIDDYGPDNLEIIIKGISGTAHAFPTYRSTNAKGTSNENFSDMEHLQSRAVALPCSESGYNHRGAFYAFRNEIMRYKDVGNYDRKELRVYDLYDEQSYKCILLEFSVDRTAEKPFHYPFTISLFVYARLDSKKAAQPKKVDISKDPFSALDVIDKSLKWFNTAARYHQEIINAVALVQNTAQLIEAKLKMYATTARSIIDSPLPLAKQLFDVVVGMGTTIKGIWDQNKMSFDQYASMTEMLENMEREVLGLFGYAISEGSQRLKEEVIPEDTGLVIDGTDVNRGETLESYSFDGLIVYTVKGKDTLQSIAQSQLGDENLWPYIASINKLLGNEDLIVNSKIYLPVSSDTGAVSKDSFIITEDTDRDPYGTDIRLDMNGNIVIQENGDVALSSGIDNIQQAVDLIFGTVLGSVLKQTAFGLASQPGNAGTELSVKYLRMGIVIALMQDPRIESVANLILNIDGDIIKAGMDIKPIGYDKTLPVSVII